MTVNRSLSPGKFVSLAACWVVTQAAIAGEATVVTEFQRNAPAWKTAEPRFFGYAFDQYWPSLGVAHSGCNVDEGDPTAARTLTLTGGTVTVTARNSSGQGICPFVDGTSQEQTSDAFVESGGEVTFQFSPPISAFYTNYGSLAVGNTCTMRTPLALPQGVRCVTWVGTVVRSALENLSA